MVLHLVLLMLILMLLMEETTLMIYSFLLWSVVTRLHHTAAKLVHWLILIDGHVLVDSTSRSCSDGHQNIIRYRELAAVLLLFSRRVSLGATS